MLLSHLVLCLCWLLFRFADWEVVLEAAQGLPQVVFRSTNPPPLFFITSMCRFSSLEIAVVVEIMYWAACLFFSVYSTKASAKGKAAGKAGTRFWKNVGLGFKTPREAIEGTDMCSRSRAYQSCHLSQWSNLEISLGDCDKCLVSTPFGFFLVSHIFRCFCKPRSDHFGFVVILL